jgi:carbon monoxide dehydrogenase subunit G
MEIHIRIVERHQNERAVYTGWGNGLGSNLTLEAGFGLTERADGGGTHVDWYGEANIDGPVAPLASSLFHPLSQRNFDHLQHALETDPADERGS